MTRVNTELGTSFSFSHIQDDHEYMPLYVFEDRGSSGGFVTLVFDHAMPAQYVQVEMQSAESVAMVSSILSDQLGLMDVEALKSAARRSGEDRGTALARLGIAAPLPYDPEIGRLIEEGLTSEQSSVRAGAATAAFLFKWSELGDALEEALEKEEAEDPARMLEAALHMCDGGSLDDFELV